MTLMTTFRMRGRYAFLQLYQEFARRYSTQRPEVHRLQTEIEYSAFPGVSSLRYSDEDIKTQHHILCRDKTFQEPEGGWHKNGRIYLAVCGISNPSTRFGLFESYRRQIASKNKRTIPPKSAGNKEKAAESSTTMITVGHGRFKAGIFSRITTHSLSGQGGLAVVGPLSKTDNTSGEIKTLAFEKFTQQNRRFRQKYTSPTQFKLVYPDGSLVNTLPDGEGEFSILAYRNFLDPQRRFDRLRFFLCDKRNFDANQPVEIVSASSSDEDLPTPDYSQTDQISENPELENETSSSSTDTLPLCVDIVFFYGAQTFQQTFPNNVKCFALLEFVKEKINTTEMKVILKIKNTQIVINDDDRLLEISTSSRFNVSVETIEQSERDETGDLETVRVIVDKCIPADFHERDTSVVDRLVDITLDDMQGIGEPTAVLKKFIEHFMRGRPLDITDESVVLEGDTSCLFISRYSIYSDSMEEIRFVQDIRLPIEITFNGESARDYGGPRKEFLTIMLKEIVDRLLEVDAAGNRKLVRNDEALARHQYYYAGLFIGISALQAGPFADFINEILMTSESEEKHQFVLGLEQTGIKQLIERTTTVKFLFQKETKREINVNKLLHLFHVDFAEEGSNRRSNEDATYRSFVRYVREVYAGRRPPVILGNILSFATGSEQEPPLGFSMRPSLQFVPGYFATASTCINKLNLPLMNQMPESTYFENLDLAFTNQFFGLE